MQREKDTWHVWRHEAPIDESVMCYVLYIYVNLGLYKSFMVCKLGSGLDTNKVLGQLG